MIQWDPRALDVLARLRKAGFQAVLVGGCVRDFLRGQEPHDYDAATSARPEEILSACADLPCIPTGLRHGTVTVLSQGLPVEVTAFRRGISPSAVRPRGGPDPAGLSTNRV